MRILDEIKKYREDTILLTKRRSHDLLKKLANSPKTFKQINADIKQTREIIAQTLLLQPRPALCQLKPALWQLK